MSKVCEVTGKRPIVGNNVSHSNHKSKRRFYPNLLKKKFYVPELEQFITIKVAASALRTIDKKGIYNYLKEMEAKGNFTFPKK